jgi:hypothetical protein
MWSRTIWSQPRQSTFAAPIPTDARATRRARQAIDVLFDGPHGLAGTDGPEW